MARTVAIGVQDFEKIISRNNFYIDKTLFIKDWWESDDAVTLITRPRRFGKTLNMNMLERFFSVKFEGKGEIFDGLDIWKEEKYRQLQGTYPVIFLSFAGVKANNYKTAIQQIFLILTNLYSEFYFLRDSGKLNRIDREFFDNVGMEMSDGVAIKAIQELAKYLYNYYGKKVVILLDEYDTPMQEAYVHGYWNEMVAFIRNLFNNIFKTNPYLERAVMTGITRISKESLFSDLNNLRVITVTSNEYASYFGFTEKEVFAAMDEFDKKNKNEVKQWYDGFTIGNLNDIYNPWSIIYFLKEGKLKAYWANTSSNGLVNSLIKEGNKEIKIQFESLLSGKTIWSKINEEIVFNQLTGNERAVWSLLLASGYLKVLQIKGKQYELTLTNYEVKQTFEDMVSGWFEDNEGDYNGFVKALLAGNIKEMNAYMNRVSLAMFSSFDGGTHPSEFSMPEKFYHGFVLGLLVELQNRYEVTSNRESGFGRYDVMLRPLDVKGDAVKNNGIKDKAIIKNSMKNDAITKNSIKNDAIIMEFKVYDSDDESSMEETVQAALRQIEEKEYEQILINQGIEKRRIRKYGFAFNGKKVLIG